MGSNEVREAKVVELVIMMDTTGSMSPSIEMCKQHAQNLYRMSKMAIPANFDLKMITLGPKDDVINQVFDTTQAFKSYKHHGNSGHLEFIQFTRDEESLNSFIQGLRATGGNGCEDIVGGLKTGHAMGESFTITRMFWKGTCFQMGYAHMTLLTKLAELGIDYYFVQVIPAYTDMMVAKFKEAFALADRRRIFESMHVNEFKADFLTAMLGALSRSLGVRPLTGEALAARLAQARAR
eukprot:gene25820-11495_t